MFPFSKGQVYVTCNPKVIPASGITGFNKVTKLYLTGVEVFILLGEVLILVHPLSVAFEEDL